MKCYVDNIIMPFVTQKGQELKLGSTNHVTDIFDNYHGQTNTDILSYLESLPLRLPVNCTDKLQPLDIL